MYAYACTFIVYIFYKYTYFIYRGHFMFPVCKLDRNIASGKFVLEISLSSGEWGGCIGPEGGGWRCDWVEREGVCVSERGRGGRPLTLLVKTKVSTCPSQFVLGCGQCYTQHSHTQFTAFSFTQRTVHAEYPFNVSVHACVTPADSTTSDSEPSSPWGTCNHMTRR